VLGVGTSVGGIVAVVVDSGGIVVEVSVLGGCIEVGVAPGLGVKQDSSFFSKLFTTAFNCLTCFRKLTTSVFFRGCADVRRLLRCRLDGGVGVCILEKHPGFGTWVVIPFELLLNDDEARTVQGPDGEHVTALQVDLPN